MCPFTTRSREALFFYKKKAASRHALRTCPDDFSKAILFRPQHSKHLLVRNKQDCFFAIDPPHSLLTSDFKWRKSIRPIKCDSIINYCIRVYRKASPASAEPCVVTQFDEVEAATKTCLDIVLDNLFVPANVTLKLNLTDGATVTFKGNITFGYAIWDGPLVTINGTSITVKGAEGSVCDGQGQLYWDGQGGWSGPKPQFFTIQAFGGSVFRDIYVLNSPMDVVQVTNSDDVLFTNWVIDDSVGDKGVAPTGKEGHNTDAFDVWNSTNVEIRDSIVYNQDDCLAVRCGANVYVHDLFCHGSHGLSISVGFSNDSVPLNTLENVTIADSVIVNSDNGIHIKTHIDGGYGSIKNVTYRNITMSDMNNFGITIEQNYQNRAPGSTGTAEPKNNVPISDLKMINVTGTVGSKAVPIHIVCAEDGCFDWSWSGVSVTGKKSNDCNYEPQGYSC